MLTDMMKGNLTNVLPMILIGGWINWAFSGFVTSMSFCYLLELKFRTKREESNDHMGNGNVVLFLKQSFVNVIEFRGVGRI